MPAPSSRPPPSNRPARPGRPVPDGPRLGPTRRPPYFRGLLWTAALAVAAWTAYVMWPTDEHAIGTRLDRLAGTLSVPPSMTDFERTVRLAELRRAFAENVHVRAGRSGPEIASRDALLAVLASWTPAQGAVGRTADEGTAGRGWTVEFVDKHITVDRAAATASVYLTAKVSGPATGDEPALDAREATVTMAKQDGAWVVTGVEVEDTLRKP